MPDIVNNKPLPPIRRRGAKPIYPWAQMQPGQAFKFNAGASMNGATSLAYQSGRQHGMKFAVRLVDGEIWCWRVDGTPYAVPNGNYRQFSERIDDYGAAAKPADETNVVGPDDPGKETDII